MANSAATLVIGRSMGRAADALADAHGIAGFPLRPVHRAEACDAFTQALAEISGRPAPQHSRASGRN